MKSPQLLNMVQLGLREGVLTLQKPIMQQEALKEPVALGYSIEAIRDVLISEKTDVLVFIPRNPELKMRVELTEECLKWLEKSQYGIQEYIFSFQTHTLVYNQKQMDASFLPGFVQKIDKLARDLQSGLIRVLAKSKR